MSYEDSINDIKGKLTGDSKKDKEFLLSQMEFYADSEYNEEIIPEIGRMFFNLLSEDEIEEYIGAVMDDMSSVIDLLEQLGPLLDEEKFSEALKEVESFIEGFNFEFEDNEQDEYHLFDNPIQFNLFLKNYTGNKNIIMLPDEYNYTALLNLYGMLLMECDRTEEGLEAFKKALKYNPFDTDILTFIMKHYDMIEDNKKVEKYAEEILKYGYDHLDIALAYRLLGYWYYEYEDFETAAAAYIISLIFEEDSLAAKLELCLINDRIPIKNVDVLKVLDSKNIPIAINPQIIEIAEELTSKAKKENDLMFINFLSDFSNQLISRTELKKKLKDLEDDFDEILKTFQL